METMNTFKDFFDNDVNDGDWLVKTGLGNKDGKYAMIMYYVVDAANQRILTLDYYSASIKSTKISSPKKYIKVDPPDYLKSWFLDTRDILSHPSGYKLSTRTINEISKFVHKGVMPKYLAQKV